VLPRWTAATFSRGSHFLVPLGASLSLADAIAAYDVLERRTLAQLDLEHSTEPLVDLLVHWCAPAKWAFMTSVS
jgi:hypothetical protein